MCTHDICFRGKIRKKNNTFWLENILSRAMKSYHGYSLELLLSRFFSKNSPNLFCDLVLFILQNNSLT